jgi:hypothetical protein
MQPKTNESFESYLQDVYCRENLCILDDELPDHFVEWFNSLDMDEIIKYVYQWTIVKEL